MQSFDEKDSSSVSKLPNDEFLFEPHITKSFFLIGTNVYQVQGAYAASIAG